MDFLRLQRNNNNYTQDLDLESVDNSCDVNKVQGRPSAHPLVNISPSIKYELKIQQL